MKNGKKICWNYRKGRCRFGSNCSYAHDSDIHVADVDKDSNVLPSSGNNQISKTTNNATISSKSNQKKRPGLGDSIIPSKKVIKAYNVLKK